MPIMAANAQSDARGAAWLLASAAQKCIDDPHRAPEWQDALNNTYRLLEAFRRNVFFGTRPLRDWQSGQIEGEMLAMMPSSERHLSELRDAMESALASSFRSIPKEDAVEKISSVLRAVAAPERFKASQDDIQGTKAFFSDLLKRLASS